MAAMAMARVCGFCFLTLGSQERGISAGDSVFHKGCFEEMSLVEKIKERVLEIIPLLWQKGMNLLAIEEVKRIFDARKIIAIKSEIKVVFDKIKNNLEKLAEKNFAEIFKPLAIKVEEMAKMLGLLSPFIPHASNPPPPRFIKVRAIAGAHS